ncbi:MAG: hypothetical protein M3Z33_12510 [Actinomycetota bacterium]|nr:hypothetical protein [Actinomycetota bacterium]
MPLNHVALTVNGRERSAAFYGKRFGLTARVHDDGHRQDDGSFVRVQVADPDGCRIDLYAF